MYTKNDFRFYSRGPHLDRWTQKQGDDWSADCEHQDGWVRWSQRQFAGKRMATPVNL